MNEWVKFGEFEMRRRSTTPSKKLVRIDDATNPEKFAKLTPTQQYWTNRWSDQMNYRYWKDRCLAEMTTQGVKARQLFYEGTLAYKTAEFEKAVAEVSEGLDIWQKLLESHKDYRDDDLNKKDTGLIVKRYIRRCKQLGEPEP